MRLFVRSSGTNNNQTSAPVDLRYDTDAYRQASYMFPVCVLTLTHSLTHSLTYLLTHPKHDPNPQRNPNPNPNRNPNTQSPSPKCWSN